MGDSVWRISVSTSTLKEEEGPGESEQECVFLKHKMPFLKADKPGVSLCPLGKIDLLEVDCVATRSTLGMFPNSVMT